jgi:hypothetical protein
MSYADSYCNFFSQLLAIFWVADALAQGKFDVKYFPGKENLADYQSKHHTGAHHLAVHPWYLHKPMSVCILPWACKPSTLKGNVRTLPVGYGRTSPLPQVLTKLGILTYLGIPVLIPALCRAIVPTIARVQIP